MIRYLEIQCYSWLLLFIKNIQLQKNNKMYTRTCCFSLYNSAYIYVIYREIRFRIIILPDTRLQTIRLLIAI